jgi:hypothetical protein
MDAVNSSETSVSTRLHRATCQKGVISVIECLSKILWPDFSQNYIMPLYAEEVFRESQCIYCVLIVTPWGFSFIRVPDPTHTCSGWLQGSGPKGTAALEMGKYYNASDRPTDPFSRSLLYPISKASWSITYRRQQQAYFRATRCSIRQ